MSVRERRVAIAELIECVFAATATATAAPRAGWRSAAAATARRAAGTRLPRRRPAALQAEVLPAPAACTDARRRAAAV
jgi:hypothetical protein